MRRIYLATGLVVALSILGLFTTVSLLEAQAAPNIPLIAAGNLGIYSDKACTQPLTSVNWGPVAPGSIVTQTIYIKNLANYNQKLTLSTTNWNPTTLKGAIALSWKMGRARVDAGQTIAANLTLTISPNASGFTAFRVDVVITGTSWGRVT